MNENYSPFRTFLREMGLTYSLLVLFVLGACSSVVGFYHMSAVCWMFAAATLLCINTNTHPGRLLWRWARLAVGHKFDTRFHWGELNLHRPYFDIGFRISERGEDGGNRDMLIVAFVVGSLYLHLPTRICFRFRFKDTSIKSVSEDSDYGFYTIDTTIVWRWNCGYYSWHIPFFSFNHLSKEVLSIDGKRSVYIEYSGKGDRRDRYKEQKAAELAHSETHPYTYTRKNGEVQHRQATIYVDRMSWRRKWFPFLVKVRTSIWVSFNEEIGEEVGSWKGGTTGCGYSMERGETALQCLRRMEQERKFHR